MVAINTTDIPDEHHETLKSKAELYFYDCSSSKKINKLHRIDEHSCKFNLALSVLCIEQHPRKFELFVMGDSEGQVSIWSAAKGLPIFVYREFCNHLRINESYSNPICDIKFMPDGEFFFTSTFFGGVSLYSSTSGDLQAITYTEQFTPLDFFFYESCPKFCNAEREPQEFLWGPSFFDVPDFFKQKLLLLSENEKDALDERGKNLFEFENFFQFEQHQLELKLASLNIKAEPVTEETTQQQTAPEANTEPEVSQPPNEVQSEPDTKKETNLREKRNHKSQKPDVSDDDEQQQNFFKRKREPVLYDDSDSDVHHKFKTPRLRDKYESQNQETNVHDYFNYRNSTNRFQRRNKLQALS